MQFMADITIPCEACGGKRFKRDVLEVEYRGKNISDVLDMTVDDAIAFFSQANGAAERRIVKRLEPLQQVGLGYVKLGQSSSTLSGLEVPCGSGSVICSAGCSEICGFTGSPIR